MDHILLRVFATITVVGVVIVIICEDTGEGGSMAALAGAVMGTAGLLATIVTAIWTRW